MRASRCIQHSEQSQPNHMGFWTYWTKILWCRNWRQTVMCHEVNHVYRSQCWLMTELLHQTLSKAVSFPERTIRTGFCTVFNEINHAWRACVIVPPWYCVCGMWMGLIGISDGYGLMGIKLKIQAWYCWISWGRMLMGCFSGWVGYQILWGLKPDTMGCHGTYGI